ncbi:hypothetical protein C8R44DRAFT_444355 [Mycena epipterygia]|nr:hypothetical protein C8R44DRAFT_444355 [Mycena epipterygia]
MIDLAFVVIEIGAMSFVVHLVATIPENPLRNLFDWCLAPNLILLLVSSVFRTATILKSKQRIFSQRFSFLGGCFRAHPPYTPLRILLTRSLARPLVRGESRPIIFTRALVLSCIIVGVPLFAIYAIIFAPLAATNQVYTKSLVYGGLNFIPGNVTLVLTWLFDPFSNRTDVPKTEVSISTIASSGDVITCPGLESLDFVQCPIPWSYISSISISVSFAPGILLVYPAQGILPAGFEYDQVPELGGGIPVFPGSHVVGAMSWTARQSISRLSWGSTKRITLFVSEITGLQPRVFPDTPNANLTTLNLTQLQPYSMRVLQDTVDVTVLSGVATFGGFWTFVNGAFALFFGANIVYFAFVGDLSLRSD